MKKRPEIKLTLKIEKILELVENKSSFSVLIDFMLNYNQQKDIELNFKYKKNDNGIDCIEVFTEEDSKKVVYVDKENIEANLIHVITKQIKRVAPFEVVTKVDNETLGRTEDIISIDYIF